MLPLFEVTSWLTVQISGLARDNAKRDLKKIVKDLLPWKNEFAEYALGYRGRVRGACVFKNQFMQSHFPFSFKKEKELDKIGPY